MRIGCRLGWGRFVWPSRARKAQPHCDSSQTLTDDKRNREISRRRRNLLWSRPMHSHSLDQWTHDHVFLGAQHERNERRTWFVVALTVIMMVGEITAGSFFE